MAPQKNIALREAIRRGYEAGKRVQQIADETGSTYGSVKVLASKMGLRHPNPDRGGGDRKRGFSIPAELREDYFLYRIKGYSAAEAADALGIERASA